MKILIDIGHPGHVHYFRNTIKNLESKGHTTIITARDKGVIRNLLYFYNLPYINRGVGKDSRIGKLLYMMKADALLLFHAKKFKPDLFLSFSSPYAAQVASILRKPHIALNDTEHTDKIHSKFTYPFSTSIITPESYQNQLGEKQIKFNNIIEALYLHHKYFTPNANIFKYLNIEASQKYVLLRFVSWNAHHDYGQSGINLETKRALIKLLSPRYKVLISSEGELDDEFKQYQINIPPEKMHDVLYYASLFVGESGTMASESSFLGTPAVYINSLPLMCYLQLEQEAGILKHFSSSNGVLDYVKKIIQDPKLKENTIIKAKKMKLGFIDATSFLTWFVENYPASVETMKESPDYQYKFK
jgi:predicted glycosyltransferase